MAVPLISCPLCSQPGFSTLESLRDGLIGSATRQIVCPVCHDVLVGLDKFTIHLFSHFLQNSCHQQRYQSQSHLIETLFNINQSQQEVHPNFKPTENLVQISYNVQNNANVISNLQSNNNAHRKNPNAARTHLKISKSKPAEEASHSVEVKQVAAQQVKTISQSTESFITHADSTFENVALLESCGLKQDMLGIVSKALEVRPEDEAPQFRGIYKETETQETLQQPDIQVEEIKANSIVKLPELRCQLCNFSFPDEHILLLHRQLVHNGEGNNDKKPFGCYLCTKEFKMRGSLMVHLRVAHGGASNLRNIANKDPDSVVKQFACTTCGKTFKKEQHLSQHSKTHEGKQWPCDVCQKLFTTKYFLKKHKRLHTGEMPYSCNICSKTFTFQQSMHKHALYHRDDKPHACTECNRTFKELSTLHNHRRIHTGEKPFACETCGKCFRQRVSYLVHRRIHTGIMPYKCTACGKSFRYKVSERTHKCPSQPPGTVVRQAGELVQKLQQRAALQASGQPTDEQLLNTNQFIIILDNSEQKVYVSQHVSDDPTREHWSAASNLMLENKTEKAKDKSKDLSGIEGLDLMVETADFFSMVDSMPSPAERMRNLTISSPNVDSGGVDEINSVHMQPEVLQTINEDSIKQFFKYTAPL